MLAPQTPIAEVCSASSSACPPPLASPFIPAAARHSPAPASPLLAARGALVAAQAAAAPTPAAGGAAPVLGHAGLSGVDSNPVPPGLRSQCPLPRFYSGGGARPFVRRACRRANLTSDITMSPW